MNASESDTKLSVKQILVPVDFSDCSKLAVRYASRIACKIKASIKLFHVYYTPAFDLIELTGSVQVQANLKNNVSQELLDAEEENIRKFITEIIPYLETCEFINSDIEYELRPGVPEDEIIRYAHQTLPNLIVMGTHGKDKANKFLGSVTESVMLKLKLPILAIPEKYEFTDQEVINNLLYVTAFDESDFNSIRKLMNLTLPLDVSVFCWHIGEEEGEWDKLKMDGLKAYFKNAYGKTRVECGFFDGKDSLSEIDSLIKKRNIDILSVTSRRRNIIDKLFKPNLTKKLFYHTNIPLLVFHE